MKKKQIVKVVGTLVVIISVIAGVYYGFQFGIYFMDNGFLGPLSQNVFYPLFILIMSGAGGVVSGILSGMVVYLALEDIRREEWETDW